jgi:alkylation response protein AidB-like acyl-CoA dehydrogenase
MDVKFSAEQEILRNSARRFLERNCPSSLVREMAEDEKGYPEELWKGMAELGWMGLMIPEAFGGVGMGFLELTVLLEEMGRVLLPGPFSSRPLCWAASPCWKQEMIGKRESICPGSPAAREKPPWLSTNRRAFTIPAR